MGGLGNQMQQYALYRKFISLGKEAYLDTSWYDGVSGDGTTVRKLEIDRFALADYQTANRASVSRFTGSGNLFAKIRNRLIPSASRYIRESAPYQPGIFERDDCLFEGYWSADKYYADIADDLRRCFSFEPMLDRDSDKKAQIAKIRTAIDEAPFSCSVHIRRGDYLKPGIAEEFGGIIAICVILVCLSCFIIIMNVAMSIQDFFYKLIAVGFGCVYGIQVFLNIGGVIKCIPSTGLTLPFVSYGGSSIFCTILMFAIIQGLYIIRRKEGDSHGQAVGTQKQTIRTPQQPNAGGQECRTRAAGSAGPGTDRRSERPEGRSGLFRDDGMEIHRPGTGQRLEKPERRSAGGRKRRQEYVGEDYDEEKW